MVKVVTRYWGSHFKTDRQSANFVVQFKPLIEQGWQCHLVLERRPENLKWLVGLQDLGVVISCVPRPTGNFDAKSVQAIRRLCRQTGCNVFHCDNMHMSPLIGAYLARVPVRVWCKRAMNSHYEACRQPTWKERLAITSRLSVALATRVLTVSSAVADELVELGLPCGKFHILNNPRPEMPRFSTSRYETRARLGIPQEDIVLIAIGRAEPVKGWDILAEAFECVAAKSPQVRLLLVGAETVNGHEAFSATLRARISISEYGDQVQFVGYVNDVLTLLIASDVFVLPSRSEGCCNALLEALEVGLPCVATKVGNVTEVLGEGNGGQIVPRNDPHTLGEVLCRLVSDDKARAQLASKAQIPDSVCDRRAHAERIVDLYEDLLRPFAKS